MPGPNFNFNLPLASSFPHNFFPASRLAFASLPERTNALTLAIFLIRCFAFASTARRPANAPLDDLYVHFAILAPQRGNFSPCLLVRLQACLLPWAWVSSLVYA